MPLGINIRHSNRSQQALDNSLNQAQRGPQQPANNPPSASPIVPGDDDQAYNPRNSLPPPSYANPHGELHSYIPADNNQGGDIRAYQESADRPSRSQSHRLSSGYPPIQPPSSVDDQVLTDYSRSYNTAQLQKPQPPLPVEQKKKSSRFFGFTKSKGPAEPPPPSDQQSSHNNLGGLGRRISIRHRDLPPAPQVPGQGISGDRPPQIPGWQSGQSSESHLESPHEADEEQNAERYIIQHPQQDLDRTPEPGQHQLQNPTIRLPGSDQESTIRLVDENWQRQYQQPPQLLTQQQWIAQQNHQASNSPVPISPVSQQQNDYQHPNQQIGQYQTYPVPSQPPPNSQVRSSTNPEVVSQLSYDSPIDTPEDQRPVSVHSNKYTSHPQAEYPTRTTSIQSPQAAQSVPQQPIMPPPPSTSQLQGRRSTDTKQALQQEGRTGPPPSYTQQQQSFGPNSGNQGSSSTSSNQTSGSQQGSTYRGSSLQREYSQAGSGAEQGRSTPPLSSDRDRELTEMDKLGKLYKFNGY